MIVRAPVHGKSAIVRARIMPQIEHIGDAPTARAEQDDHGAIRFGQVLDVVVELRQHGLGDVFDGVEVTLRFLAGVLRPNDGIYWFGGSKRTLDALEMLQEVFSALQVKLIARCFADSHTRFVEEPDEQAITPVLARIHQGLNLLLADRLRAVLPRDRLLEDVLLDGAVPGDAIQEPLVPTRPFGQVGGGLLPQVFAYLPDASHVVVERGTRREREIDGAITAHLIDRLGRPYLRGAVRQLEPTHDED